MAVKHKALLAIEVLLTATPLQNTLMELFGLVSFIDPHVFGSEAYFRTEFSRKAGDVSAAEFLRLRERIQPICQRTLRRQVLEYIRYTNRISSGAPTGRALACECKEQRTTRV